jgi:hypothetical protein
MQLHAKFLEELERAVESMVQRLAGGMGASWTLAMAIWRLRKRKDIPGVIHPQWHLMEYPQIPLPLDGD